MKPRKDYLFTAQVGDKFHALSFDNDVYTWDMQTGKLEEQEEENF